MNDKLVYSTATGSAKGQKDKKENGYQRGSGPMKMRLETNGRGGKAVTVLFNLSYASEEEARAVMQEMQSTLGCGATLKDAAIELRGDQRDRAEAWLAKRGVKIVRAGG